MCSKKSSEKLLSYKRCQNYVALIITALEKEETEKTQDGKYI